VAADSHNFDEEQAPEPDPDLHQMWKDPEQHFSDADPQHCPELGKIGGNLLHAWSLGARLPWQKRLTKKNNESQHSKAVDPCWRAVEAHNWGKEAQNGAMELLISGRRFT
jgi:hypothetical protein